MDIYSRFAGGSAEVNAFKEMVLCEPVICRDKAPGQLECETAIAALNSCLRDLDQASLAAVSQQLAPREGISQEVRRNVFKNGDVRLGEGDIGVEGFQGLEQTESDKVVRYRRKPGAGCSSV